MFLTMQIWVDLVIAQAEGGFGWWWGALVLDRTRDGARAKHGAVAQGMIFDSISSLACNKFLSR